MRGHPRGGPASTRLLARSRGSLFTVLSQGRLHQSRHPAGCGPSTGLWGHPCRARGARTLSGPFSWLLPVCVVGSGQDMAEGPRSPHEASWWQPPAAPSSHVSPRPDGCHLSPSDTRGPGYPLAPPQLPASLPAPGSAITLPPPPGSSRPHTPAGLRDITAPPGPRNACWASREPGECSHS